MKNYQEIQDILRKEPKKWVITGVAGFIGSNLLETLLNLDQLVTGVDNFSTGKNHNLEEVKKNVDQERWKNFTFIEGDISLRPVVNAFFLFNRRP